jgi:penicillin-binding protein 1C
MEYYYKIKHSDYRSLPPYQAGCEASGSNVVMEMIYPKAGASVYIPIELDGSRGKVVFNATHRKSGAKIYWHIDQEYVGTTNNYHQMELSPVPGQHVLTLVDEDGERLQQRFIILKKP